MNKILKILAVILLSISPICLYAQVDENTTTKSGGWRIDNGTNYALEYFENNVSLSNKYSTTNVTYSNFTNLQGQITIETNRAYNAETNIQNNLNIAIEGASNALYIVYTNLQGKINIETNRAYNAETNIQNNLNIASNALNSVDTNLQAQINIETNRAYNSETNIQNNINIASNSLHIVDTNLQDQINIETNRAYNAETNIQNNLNIASNAVNIAITSEVGRAEQAESALNTAVSNRVLKSGDIMIGNLKGPSALVTNDYTTLQDLLNAIGNINVLYASTNKSFGFTNYYDARTFIPTHADTVITNIGVTNGQYLAKWISNTNLITRINKGTAIISGRMRITTSVGGKTLIVKPELYIRYADTTEPELFTGGQPITLSSTLTTYLMSIDCSSNVFIPIDARIVVKYKVVSQNNNPDWEFNCGSNLLNSCSLPSISVVTVAETNYASRAEMNAETNRAYNAETNIQNNLNIASNALNSVDTNIQYQITNKESGTNWSKYRSLQHIDMGGFSITNLGTNSIIFEDGTIINSSSVSNWNISMTNVDNLYGPTGFAYFSNNTLTITHGTNGGGAGIDTNMSYTMANGTTQSVDTLIISNTNGVRQVVTAMQDPLFDGLTYGRKNGAWFNFGLADILAATNSINIVANAALPKSGGILTGGVTGTVITANSYNFTNSTIMNCGAIGGTNGVYWTYNGTNYWILFVP